METNLEGIKSDCFIPPYSTQMTIWQILQEAEASLWDSERSDLGHTLQTGKSFKMTENDIIP